MSDSESSKANPHQGAAPKQNRDEKKDEKKPTVSSDALLRLIEAMKMPHPDEGIKDMKNHKFWSTQPVPAYDEVTTVDGPIKIINPERVSKTPPPLLEGFEWVTLDLDDSKQLDELYNLLEGHYVEDQDQRFRFKYSRDFLSWAFRAPGWQQHKDLFIGVRSIKSKALLAFISGIPVTMRIRDARMKCSEVNFLCVHKKLRSIRLAPVLIAEVTRRSYLSGIYQGVYTAGQLLPTPLSVCRYYHRSINWEKLFEVGFAVLPDGSTREAQIAKYALPDNTSLEGLREAKLEDVEQIHDLLTRYLARSEMAQEFSKEEVAHWLIGRPQERVIWSYVVESPQTGRVTDFFSFYNLESTIIGHEKYSGLNVAYQFYYATDQAFTGNQNDLKKRLNELMGDILVISKQLGFDVFNALTLLDNPLFLEEHHFGQGDGYLHYYMFNYKAASIAGSMDDYKRRDMSKRFGVGLIML